MMTTTVFPASAIPSAPSPGLGHPPLPPPPAASAAAPPAAAVRPVIGAANDDDRGRGTGGDMGGVKMGTGGGGGGGGDMGMGMGTGTGVSTSPGERKWCDTPPPSRPQQKVRHRQEEAAEGRFSSGRQVIQFQISQLSLGDGTEAEEEEEHRFDDDDDVHGFLCSAGAEAAGASAEEGELRRRHDGFSSTKMLPDVVPRAPPQQQQQQQWQQQQQREGQQGEPRALQVQQDRHLLQMSQGGHNHQGKRTPGATGQLLRVQGQEEEDGQGGGQQQVATGGGGAVTVTVAGAAAATAAGAAIGAAAAGVGEGLIGDSIRRHDDILQWQQRQNDRELVGQPQKHSQYQHLQHQHQPGEKMERSPATTVVTGNRPQQHHQQGQEGEGTTPTPMATATTTSASTSAASMMAGAALMAAAGLGDHTRPGIGIGQYRRVETPPETLHQSAAAGIVGAGRFQQQQPTAHGGGSIAGAGGVGTMVFPPSSPSSMSFGTAPSVQSASAQSSSKGGGGLTPLSAGASKGDDGGPLPMYLLPPPAVTGGGPAGAVRGALPIQRYQQQRPPPLLYSAIASLEQSSVHSLGSFGRRFMGAKAGAGAGMGSAAGVGVGAGMDAGAGKGAPGKGGALGGAHGTTGMAAATATAALGTVMTTMTSAVQGQQKLPQQQLLLAQKVHDSGGNRGSVLGQPVQPHQTLAAVLPVKGPGLLAGTKPGDDRRDKPLEGSGGPSSQGKLQDGAATHQEPLGDDRMPEGGDNGPSLLAAAAAQDHRPSSQARGLPGAAKPGPALKDSSAAAKAAGNPKAVRGGRRRNGKKKKSVTIDTSTLEKTKRSNKLKKAKDGPVEMFRPSCDAYTPRLGRHKMKDIKYKPAELRTPQVQKMSSTMGTIQRPNFRDALRRVAMILHEHIVKIERRFEGGVRGVDDTGLFSVDMRDLFSESNFITPRYKCSLVRLPMARPGAVYGLRRIKDDYSVPTTNEIYEFGHQLFKAVQLSSECSIVCLIYVERLMEVAKVPLVASTWRPIFMCGLLLASKVWQDLSSWNIEFASVYPQFSLEAINRLEALVLKTVKWDLYISSSLYAKYYFALRSLLEKQDFRRRYNQMVGVMGNVAASDALKVQKRSERAKEEALLQLSRSM